MPSKKNFSKDRSEHAQAMRTLRQRNLDLVLMPRRTPGACLTTLGTALEFKRNPENFLTVSEHMAAALQMCQSVIAKNGMFDLSERLAHQYANEALERWKKS